MLNKDFFFEFAGMPKSGKTTVFDIVVHFLKRKGLRVQEYHGGGRYAPIDKSALASLDMYLACKAAEFLIVSSEREKAQSKIFMMDRGIYDKCIFTLTLSRMGRIDAEAAEATRRFLSVPQLTRLVDGVFVFVTSSELSLKREYNNRLIEKPGRIMNSDVLEMLRLVILEETSRTTSVFRNLQLIDTEKADGNISECARLVADQIVAIVGEQQ